MEISRKYCKAVFDDALSAVTDKNHPCHHLVEWQNKEGYRPFQLPEPFSGRKTSLGIAFVGLNPSISHNENIPTYSQNASNGDFEKYDEFYRSRFDDKYRDGDGKLFVEDWNNSNHKVRLWNNIEIFGNQCLALKGRSFKIGEHALLIEAVRYKATKGFLGTSKEKKAAMGHQKKFTQDLIDEGKFSVLVPMGNAALRQLSEVLNFEAPPPSAIGQAMGNSYIGKTEKGTTVTVCPIQHLSYPPGIEQKEAVARQIKKALARCGKRDEFI